MVQLASQFTAPVGGGGSSISTAATRMATANLKPSPSLLTSRRETIWLIEALADLSILPIAFEPIDRQSDK
jgi:hypothetical protein